MPPHEPYDDGFEDSFDDEEDLFDDEDEEINIPHLPSEIFSDPFDAEEGSQPRPEIFFPSYLGIKEEDVRPPVMSGLDSTQTKGAPKEGLFSGITTQIQRINTERKSLAGVDSSPPSVWERLRKKKQEISYINVDDEAEVGIIASDPLERLLIPLSGPALAQLQAEVEAEDVILVRYERGRKSQMQQQAFGLICAIASLIIFILFAHRGAWDGSLIKANSPRWLSNSLGQNKTGALLFGVNLLVPFLTLGALADAFVFGLKSFIQRSLFNLLIGAVSACFAISILLLVSQGFSFQAVITLLAWSVFRIFVNLIMRFRD